MIPLRVAALVAKHAVWLSIEPEGAWVVEPHDGIGRSPRGVTPPPMWRCRARHWEVREEELDRGRPVLREVTHSSATVRDAVLGCLREIAWLHRLAAEKEARPEGPRRITLNHAEEMARRTVALRALVEKVQSMWTADVSP